MASSGSTSRSSSAVTIRESTSWQEVGQALVNGREWPGDRRQDSCAAVNSGERMVEAGDVGNRQIVRADQIDESRDPGRHEQRRVGSRNERQFDRCGRVPQRPVATPCEVARGRRSCRARWRPPRAIRAVPGRPPRRRSPARPPSRRAARRVATSARRQAGPRLLGPHSPPAPAAEHDPAALHRVTFAITSN